MSRARNVRRRVEGQADYDAARAAGCLPAPPAHSSFRMPLHGKLVWEVSADVRVHFYGSYGVLDGVRYYIRRGAASWQRVPRSTRGVRRAMQAALLLGAMAR